MGNNDHISTSEIKQDISDTLAEIRQMKVEYHSFRILPDRWSTMRAEHRKDGIARREVFIEKLEKILKDRED